MVDGLEVDGISKHVYVLPTETPQKKRFNYFFKNKMDNCVLEP